MYQISKLNRAESLVDLLKKGVENRVFSGAQAAWCLNSAEDVQCIEAGAVSVESPKPVDANTLFDISSVTKVFTASLALTMVDQGILDLNAELANYLKELGERSQGKATFAELLAHEAGFLPWLPLFENIPPAERGTESARKKMIDLALMTDALQDDPICQTTKAVYSDLGYIALTRILESKTGVGLAQLIKQRICEPLHLSSARFLPVGSRCIDVLSVAAAECCSWRGRTIQGEVHDDNAWTMGGVSGHAGLFAAAKDIARFGAIWLETIFKEGFISKDLASLAVARRPSGRGLGWDMVNHEGSMAGALFSRHSFGHLGFTGCSLWVDPERGLSLALNTNHVHFGRDKEKIKAFRPAFHDAAISAIIKDKIYIDQARLVVQ